MTLKIGYDVVTRNIEKVGTGSIFMLVDFALRYIKIITERITEDSSKMRVSISTEA